MILDDCYASFVNLDTRRDRLKQIQLTLGSAGIKAERTRGRLPSEYRGKFDLSLMKIKAPGNIGCYLSEKHIMETAVSLGKHAFIIEDDAVICSDIHERLAYIERFCSGRPWDIIWLSAMFHVNPPYWHKNSLGYDAKTTDDPRMIRTYGAFTTTAYIVNRDSISNVLTKLESVLERSIAIDHAFILIQPSILAYSFVPGCIIQRDGISDISGRGVKEARFSRYAQLLGPYWYQEKMDQFDPQTHNWHEAKQ